MASRKTNTIVVVILILAAVLGLGGIAVAYYFSTIADVTPESISAQEKYCYVYYLSDVQTCSSIVVPKAVKSDISERQCKNVTDQSIVIEDGYECTRNGDLSNGVCRKCEGAATSLLLGGTCQCCTLLASKDLTLCKSGESSLTCDDLGVYAKDIDGVAYRIYDPLDPAIKVAITAKFDASVTYTSLGIKINDTTVLDVKEADIVKCLAGDASVSNVCTTSADKEQILLTYNSGGEKTLDEILNGATTLSIKGYGSFKNAQGVSSDLSAMGCVRQPSLLAPEITAFGKPQAKYSVEGGEVVVESVTIDVNKLKATQAVDNFKVSMEFRDVDSTLGEISKEIPTAQYISGDLDTITITDSDVTFPSLPLPEGQTTGSYNVFMATNITYGTETYDLADGIIAVNLGRGITTTTLQAESLITCSLNSVTPSSSTQDNLTLTGASIQVTGFSSLGSTDKVRAEFVSDQVAAVRSTDLSVTSSTTSLNLDLSNRTTFPTPIEVSLTEGATSGNVAVRANLIINGTETKSCGSKDVALGSGVVTTTTPTTTTPTTTTPATTHVTSTNLTTSTEANLTIAMTGPQCVDRVSPTNRASFSIRVNNTGTTAEPVTSLVDKLPRGFTYVSGSASVTLNGVSIAQAVPTTSMVGVSQELRWQPTGGWIINAGKSLIINFSAIAGAQALTGTNLNEVFITPANDPSDDTTRESYSFSVAQSCTAPATGLLDDVASKTALGMIALGLGIIFYSVAFESRLSDSFQRSFIGRGVTRLGEIGLRYVSPRDYFSDRIGAVVKKKEQEKKYVRKFKKK